MRVCIIQRGEYVCILRVHRTVFLCVWLCECVLIVWQTLIDGMIDTHLYLCKFTIEWPWATGIVLFAILEMYAVDV